MKYRSRYDILADIVKLCKQPMLRCNILRDTYLSGYSLDTYIGSALNAGLIKTTTKEENARGQEFAVAHTAYLATPKGYDFLQLFELLESLCVFPTNMPPLKPLEA